MEFPLRKEGFSLKKVFKRSIKSRHGCLPWLGKCWKQLAIQLHCYYPPLGGFKSCTSIHSSSTLPDSTSVGTRCGGEVIDGLHHRSWVVGYLQDLPLFLAIGRALGPHQLFLPILVANQGGPLIALTPCKEGPHLSSVSFTCMMYFSILMVGYHACHGRLELLLKHLKNPWLLGVASQLWELRFNFSFPSISMNLGTLGLFIIVWLYFKQLQRHLQDRCNLAKAKVCVIRNSLRKQMF